MDQEEGSREMILAEKIAEERKKNGWSQEELAEQLGVSRQAVSKWESAGSVPDLQKVIQLAELFGVSTDYLLKDEMEPEMRGTGYEGLSESEQTLHRVTMEEANEFLKAKEKFAPLMANAVSLCILSPVLLIFLNTFSESRKLPLSENLAAGIGCMVLLAFIAAAVFIFITGGIKMSHLEQLEKEPFETEYGVTGMVKERRGAYEEKYTIGTAIGVVLCILSAIPLLIAGVMDSSDDIYGICVSVLLVLIALGVNSLIRVGMVKESYDTLLQEGEFSKQEKLVKKKLDTFSGVYWLLATAIYLAWSFKTMNWDQTWMLWPVAGVLFAAVCGIARMIPGIRDHA